MSKPEYEIPNDDDVSPEDIQPEAKLWDTDLSGADLNNANLAKAYLIGADLSGANLMGADLSGATLRRTDLSGAKLLAVNLSGADLWDADLSGTDIREADLSGANIREADLSGADLSRETTFISRKTYRKRVREGVFAVGRAIGLRSGRGDSSEDDPTEYDIVARTHGELRKAYSTNGLLSRARKARVRERRARRREAKAEEGIRGTVAWFFSVLSGFFTGYGVRLLPVVGWMLLLYFGSTFVYWHWTDWGLGYSLYYSVVTFTTAPPATNTPPGRILAIVASFETFAGTAAIIFLGYVLGSRERI